MYDYNMSLKKTLFNPLFKDNPIALQILCVCSLQWDARLPIPEPAGSGIGNGAVIHIVVTNNVCDK